MNQKQTQEEIPILTVGDNAVIYKDFMTRTKKEGIATLKEKASMVKGNRRSPEVRDCELWKVAFLDKQGCEEEQIVERYVNENDVKHTLICGHKNVNIG